ncbi:MAG: hypothetical protein F4X83_00240 [Chloroflexi bacterium]|nr:hypothetical protein [Chloroflexota bacterium]
MALFSFFPIANAQASAGNSFTLEEIDPQPDNDNHTRWQYRVVAQTAPGGFSRWQDSPWYWRHRASDECDNTGSLFRVDPNSPDTEVSADGGTVTVNVYARANSVWVCFALRCDDGTYIYAKMKNTQKMQTVVSDSCAQSEPEDDPPRRNNDNDDNEPPIEEPEEEDEVVVDPPNNNGNNQNNNGNNSPSQQTQTDDSQNQPQQEAETQTDTEEKDDENPSQPPVPQPPAEEPVQTVTAVAQTPSSEEADATPGDADKDPDASSRQPVPAEEDSIRPASTPSEPADDEDDGLSYGWIIAGIAATAIVIALFFWLRRRGNNQNGSNRGDI